MKQIQVNKAYQVLQKLSALQLPAKKAFAIYRLAKQFEDPFQFELAFEKKLMEKYNCVMAGDGMFRFPDEEKASAFQKEIEEANNMEVDISFEKVLLTWDDVNSCSLSANEILSLEGIIDFDPAG